MCINSMDCCSLFDLSGKNKKSWKVLRHGPFQFIVQINHNLTNLWIVASDNSFLKRKEERKIVD